MDELITQVVRDNPALEEARLGLAEAKRLEAAELGASEPELLLNHTRDGSRREKNAQQTIQELFVDSDPDYDEQNREYGIGLSGQLPTGGSYRFGSTINKRTSKYLEDGEFESFMGVSADQPLLKGATRGVPRPRGSKWLNRIGTWPIMSTADS